LIEIINISQALIFIDFRSKLSQEF